MKENEEFRNKLTHACDRLIFIKGTKIIKQENDNPFKNYAVKVAYPYAKIK